MTDEAEIIELFKDAYLNDDDAPVENAKKTTFCMHRLVRLDSEAHRVYCRECNAEVDPFAFLKRLAGDWEHYAAHRKEAERKARSAQARLDEILRLERNARARLKKIDPAAAKAAPAKPWGD